MMPTTVQGFLTLFLAAITVGVGYSIGTWFTGKILK